MYQQQDYKTLTTKNFQHKAGTLGGLAIDLDDISQCHETIVNTSKGDIPFNPNLGVDLIDVIGEHPADAAGIAAKIFKEELEAQEPRAEILNVDPVNADEDGLSIASITFKSKITGEIKEKIYKYGSR